MDCSIPGTLANGEHRYDGIETYTVVDEDGTLKRAKHTWAGFTWHEW